MFVFVDYDNKYVIKLHTMCFYCLHIYDKYIIPTYVIG